ncbi:MAG: serine protease [Caldimonas sp.]
MTDEDKQRVRAQELIASLALRPTSTDLREAHDLALALRNLRAFDLLCKLAEAVCRNDAGDARTRRLYAQGLIETGCAVPAIHMLDHLAATLPKQHEEAIEAWGLLGRAHKQIFFDATALGSSAARSALAGAVEAYSKPYKADPQRNTWHGVNLLALLSRARRQGWDDIAPKVDVARLAARLATTLRALPLKDRDEWFLPTLAEVSLGLGLASGDLSAVESVLHEYIGSPDVHAFQVASTLRQFTQVWQLESLSVRTPGISLGDEAAVERARALVEILRARLLQLPGGEVVMGRQQPAVVAPEGKRGQAEAVPPAPARPADGQLEAILGIDGPRVFAWWRAGVTAARSVAVVRQRLGKRLGSGFLVRGADFGRSGAADQLLLLTNFHVVNPHGAAPGIRPEDAEVVFEADDPSKAYKVEGLLWCSPVEAHDASLLRLQAVPPGIDALTVSTELPELPAADVLKRPRVYIIGYPGGRELSVSFEDNELLDHEGPPAGKQQIPGVCRVHYRTPTEGGNSGSPVFDDGAWKVIALHHKGGRFGMPRLNGLTGNYAANEGLAMSTLVAAARSEAP